MHFIAVFLLLGLSIGCDHRPPAEPQTEWMDHGNPEEFLTGAALKPIISESQLKDLNGWFSNRKFVIGRRSEISSVRKESLFSERATTEFTSEMNLVRGANEWRFRNSTGSLDLRFYGTDKSNPQLRTWNGRNVDLLHFSISAQGDMASFLFKTLDDDSLVDIILSRESQEVTQVKPSAFSFMTLARARWTGPSVKLNFCAPAAAGMMDALKMAEGRWQAVLGDRLKISVGQISGGYPPFSDLNERCVYVVNNYRISPNKSDYVFGRTFLVDGEKGQSIVDGDIMMMRSELSKIGPNSTRSQMESIVIGLVHEIGHWLGLAHPFNGNTPSVMAFSGLGELQPYDKKAIDILYGPVK